MRTESFATKFVEVFPNPLAQGYLYISTEFNSVAHLCACGCGEEVITPLSPAQWSFNYNGATVSMRPSIGNWSLPCRSHYVIKRGKVVWAKTFGTHEVARNRQRDRRALEGDVRDHDETACAAGPRAHDPETATFASANLVRRLWRRLRRTS